MLQVLMLSRDPSVTDLQSDTSQRLREYEKAGAKIYAHYASPYNCLMLLYGALLRYLHIVNDGELRHQVITSQSPFEDGLVAWMLAKLLGAKLEIQMHGDFFNPLWAKEHWSRKWRLKIARFTLRRADGIRVPSKRVANSLSRDIWTMQVAVLATPTARRIKKLPLSDKVILYAGRFSKEKNLPMLLEMFQMVREVHPDATLHLVGDGQHQIYGEGNGVASVMDMGNHLEASLAVIPSNHESWSRFAIEAALSGVPVVMTDVGCAGEIIKSSESGWVAYFGKDQFANSIIAALDNPELAEQYAQNAKLLAEALPNQEQTAKIMVENWKALCTP